MNKIIVVLIMIIFVGCSQKQDILVTKKVYPDISKNAVFDAAKTLFTLSNKENGNKSFIVDVYRDKIEVNKIIFEDNIIKVDIVLDKWILELYQTEKETRANLIVIRRDGINPDDIENINQNVHQLFWDRLDYLLGLKKEWKMCNKYFSYNLLNGFCDNYFIRFSPDNSYIQKNILISQENSNKNTIDTIKADIYEKTDLSLGLSNSDIFNQSENIEDTNMLSPVIMDDIFKTEAQKKERAKKVQNLDTNEKIGLKDLKEDKSLKEDKDIDKFKENLENIINMRPQNENTDSNKIILNSNNLKENSEFDLKSKEKK
ncbi:hypothetical protein [Arcobacter caeni]|uniref:Lipoprotein n=1 Tax=Arcobacter caeni TaxID=1912877 RepID=A0A363D6I6_9BACT|nr:hypothetical protein [Arcobacter caeni]PUE66657.1 hypothetical protein B0174_00985 [Arcobacter caeni]